MNRCADVVVALAACLALSEAGAQSVSLRWGLENTWSYSEGVRSHDGDGANRVKGGKTYRAFEFKDGDAAVREPMLTCAQRHEKLWSEFRKGRTSASGAAAGASQSGSSAERAAFEALKRE